MRWGGEAGRHARVCHERVKTVGNIPVPVMAERSAGPVARSEERVATCTGIVTEEVKAVVGVYMCPSRLIAPGWAGGASGRRQLGGGDEHKTRVATLIFSVFYCLQGRRVGRERAFGDKGI